MCTVHLLVKCPATRGLANKAIVFRDAYVVSSDHGNFMGEKGLFEKCEVPYECLLHVPLLSAPHRESLHREMKRSRDWFSQSICFRPC